MVFPSDRWLSRAQKSLFRRTEFHYFYEILITISFLLTNRGTDMGTNETDGKKEGRSV